MDDFSLHVVDSKHDNNLCASCPTNCTDCTIVSQVSRIKNSRKTLKREKSNSAHGVTEQVIDMSGGTTSSQPELSQNEPVKHQTAVLAMLTYSVSINEKTGFNIIRKQNSFFNEKKGQVED